MIDKVIIAGSGGQGIEMSGELLAESLMFQGKHVTFFPSYGAQVRGGHAYCHVVISDHEVNSPVIERPMTLIAFEQAAYDKYCRTVRPGGMVLLNSSLVEPETIHRVQNVPVPATDMALELGNMLVANMIMLGAYAQARGLLEREAFVSALKGHLVGSKAKLLAIDQNAFDAGVDLIRRKG